jgi:hypothetical protein
MNRVIYRESDDLADVVENPNKYKTMLTEWFVANQRYPDARTLTYIDFHLNGPGMGRPRNGEEENV